MFPLFEWEHFWRILSWYYVSNKTNVVSFKIAHRIYPVKDTLERFHLDIDYNCGLCNCERESIVHLQSFLSQFL